MGKKISHIAIAVKNIEEYKELFTDILELEYEGEEIVEDQKVKVAMIKIGESRIELLEPTTEDSTVHKFITKKGEGIHHIAITTDNIEKELERLKSKNVRLIDEKPRIGAGGHKIAFLHPKATKGILTEICEEH